MNQRLFIRPATVPMWAEIKDPLTDALHDPSEDVLVTLRDPDGDIVAGMEEVVATRLSTGLYYYYWASGTVDVDGDYIYGAGFYKYRFYIQDGTGANARITPAVETFELR